MITGIINGQELRLSSPIIAADTIDYLEVQFLFRSKDWIGLDTWAHFASDGASYDIRLKNGRIERGDHLNLSAGEWKVYLHGTNTNGMRITTTEANLVVLPTGASGGEPLPEIPLSASEQISMIASEALRIAKSVENDANNGKFDGSDYVITQKDKEDITRAVLASLPTWSGGEY